MLEFLTSISHLLKKRNMAADVFSVMFWISIVIVAVLVVINGLIAGLTLGLLSLDSTKLQVLISSGSTKQKRAANRVAPLRKNTHLLLATLLLGNTIINETLPILLHNIVENEWIAIGVSVVLVLTFAELMPQALCTHYGLQIGSMFAWFVYVLRFIFFPIAWPLGKLLDWLLGTDQGALYKKAELKTFVTLHGQTYGGDLTADEVKIVQGTLSLHLKTIDQVMTKLDHVFMLNFEQKLDNDTITKICESGHSRIPIYMTEKEDIIGILLVKNLILLDDSTETFVRDLYLIKAPRMKPQTNLFDAINFFQQGASHMAIIETENGQVIGICTLEDIIEEILLEEVLDESDRYTDNSYTTKVVRKARSERKVYVKPTDVVVGSSSGNNK